MLQVIVERDE